MVENRVGCRGCDLTSHYGRNETSEDLLEDQIYKPSTVLLGNFEI